jgi:hypothetical protein
VVWNELGPDATRYTINNTQFTVNHWLLQVLLRLLWCWHMQASMHACMLMLSLCWDTDAVRERVCSQ